MTACPFSLLTPEDLAAIESSNDLEDFGILPVAGGKLDQCHGFLQAHRFYRGQVNYWIGERVKKK